MTDQDDFVGRYGAIYEHSPWVAEEAALIIGTDDDRERIAAVMADCVGRHQRRGVGICSRGH